MIGSPMYMAPEVLKGNPYNVEADIWSLGIVLYEMCYWRCPYEDKDMYRLVDKVQNQSLYFDPSVAIS